MTGEQRQRLATAAANAGYPAGTLQAIAHATLPRYTPGQQLADRSWEPWQTPLSSSPKRA